MAQCSCKQDEATLVCTYCEMTSKMCRACYARHQEACEGKKLDEAVFEAQHTEGGGGFLIAIDGWLRGKRKN